MNATRLTARDFQRQPWRNGGGFTTELAREGEGERFTWRLSIAEVERDGPFSDFAGCERTIMLIEGAGMRLAFDDGREIVIDRPHVPFVFDGASRPGCRLIDGPVRDLNLIVDTARARGMLEARALDHDATFATASWSLFLCLSGVATLAAASRNYPLAPGELVRLDDAPTATVRPAPAAVLACINIQKWCQTPFSGSENGV